MNKYNRKREKQQRRTHKFSYWWWKTLRPILHESFVRYSLFSILIFFFSVLHFPPLSFADTLTSVDRHNFYHPLSRFLSFKVGKADEKDAIEREGREKGRKIRRDEGQLKGQNSFVSVFVYSLFCIHNLLVIRKRDSLFLSLPSFLFPLLSFSYSLSLPSQLFLPVTLFLFPTFLTSVSVSVCA